VSAPVQVLVVGFDEPSFSGEVLAELDRLRAAGTVRLIDVLLVRCEDDGAFTTLPPPPGADPHLGLVAAAVLGAADGDRPDGEQAGWSLADAVPPGTTAAVALLEHLWAVPLVAAIGDAGGRPLSELWLSAEDRERIPG
jgi:hypothetical protein